MSKPETIMIDDQKYIRADAVQEKAPQVDGMDHVIVRTYSAGVFAGYLAKREGKEVTLLQARRLWFWDGAASLSQLSVDGVSKPENCKFPCEVERILLTEAIEILPTTAKAKASIDGVSVWSR